jgi:uncharacterized protein YbjT (DUF2867 family)
MTKILLAGATGLIGGHALIQLLADVRVTQVVAPTRRALEPHPKLLNPINESGALPFDAPWWSVDGALCAIGTTRAKAPSAAAYRAIDFDYALAVAVQARKNGATRFAVVTSMGADARSRVRYTRIKGELEEAITALAYPSLAIARPGFLGGTRQEARTTEKLVGALLRFVAPILPPSARISEAKAVAALLVSAAIAGGPGTQVITAADIARPSARSSTGG